MIQLLGYMIVSFGTFYLILLFLRSKGPEELSQKTGPPSIQRRVVITFSLLLAFISFSLLVLLFPAVTVLEQALTGGRTDDIILGVCLAALTFLVSYLYFWRSVKS
jgi:uncharacterized membrane protein (DUF485 family)